MKDSESVIDHFFVGRILRIPVYQRNYSWSKDNCKQLFNDLLTLLSTPMKKHFFGSIIYMIDQDTDERIIIDGQQRLTTIALLLAAIRDSCEDGTLKYDKEKFVEKLNDRLYDDGEVILHTVAKDKLAYDDLIRRKNVDLNSNIGINYNYFRKKIAELDGYTGDSLFKAITNLHVMVVRLSLQDGDDPQAVFESINSTGKSLSEGDRIRNLVLMNHIPKIQTYFHEEYWTQIEENSPDLSSFFRDYLTTITGKIPKKEETYVAFRNYQLPFHESSDTYEEFLKEVRSYSKIYHCIVNNDLDWISSKSSKIMFGLNYLDANTAYPFIMRVIRERELNPNQMTSEEVTTVLETIFNMYVRRLICSLPSNALNTIYSSLFKNVLSLGGEAPFSEKLKYVILKKAGTGRYPLDTEVQENLRIQNVYERRKLCAIVLSILEDNNKDTEDTLKRVSAKILSIEHIMPQKLSQRWIDDLGENAEETHNQWVHMLGNLTLTAYNSEYSNRPYVEKRDLEVYGFKHSGLKLNDYMRNSEVWTEEQIRERHEILVNRFTKILKELDTDFSAPELEKEEEHTLYEDWSGMWGNKICGYILDGIRTDCKNAGETFVSLIKELYERDSDTFEQQCENRSNGQFGKYIVPEPGKKTIEIKEGLYLRYDFDNDTKIRLLKIMSDAMGLEPKSIYILVYMTKTGFHKRTSSLDDFDDQEPMADPS